MSYNATTKRIYVDTSTNPDTGVSIGDLQQCFNTHIRATINGETVTKLSSDLGVICALTTGDTFSDNNVTWTVSSRNEIKMLSRYKPIKDTLNGQSATPLALTDTDFMNRNWGFDIPVVNPSTINEFTDFVKGVANGSYTWNTIPISAQDVDERSIGNGWLYKRITVGTNWCRLTDFNNYTHDVEDNYVSNTLTVNNSMKLVTKKDASRYNPVFTFDMWPYCPRNFKSLENHRLGIAIYSENVPSTASGGTVYFYVGTTAISLNATIYESMTLTLPQNMLQALLDKIPTTGGTLVRETTFYCVGFFAPASCSGKNNLVDNDKGHDMSGLRPVPGTGCDTFQWQYVGGSGDYDTCLLAMTAGSESVLQAGGTGFTAKLYAVTNNYDLTNANQDGIIYFRPTYLMYTYDIIDSNGNVDETNSRTSRTSFGVHTGNIDVSNTETDGNGNVVHKTTDVSSYNITANIPVARSAARNGSRVVVYLWYLTYNSVPGTDEIYHQCGRFVVPVGVLPRD